MEMGLLDVKNLSFKYDNQIEKVFDNVSFQIDTNWKLGLIGRNGKGKTTLLELLMSKYEYRGYITPNYIFDYFPYHIENENIRTLKIVENILGEFEKCHVRPTPWAVHGEETKHGSSYAIYVGVTVRHGFVGFFSGSIERDLRIGFVRLGIRHFFVGPID